jgi:hypothetical protein
MIPKKLTTGIFQNTDSLGKQEHFIASSAKHLDFVIGCVEADTFTPVENGIWKTSKLPAGSEAEPYIGLGAYVSSCFR